MIVKGKFNEAKIFTDIIEEKAIEQIKAICDFEPLKDVKIRVMPDVHAGKGCTIGTTMTIKDKIIPNMVGVDIGCGMELMQIAEKEIDFEKLDECIRKNIPSGMNCRKIAHDYANNIDLGKLRCKEYINIERAKLSIGTLGGGNHFIEMDKDNDGNMYIVVHSGSRRLGLEIAEYYQAKAIKDLKNDRIHNVIEKLKAEGRFSEIEKTCKSLNNFVKSIPNEMAYVESALFDDYIHDMKIAQKFAVLNRKAMVDTIIKTMGYTPVDGFTCIHNYIDTDNMILRKGAVSAQKGEKILIPINMRDGALICVGKGNPDWNYSAPHGSGRVLGRLKAKETLTMDEFKSSMKGIYSTSITEETLDESPMAYKTIENIVKFITPTAEIIKQIKPVYNFKASE